MPKDLGIDWTLVEADYLRGTRLSEIARLHRLNPQTLKSRMVRGGWSAKRLAIVEASELKVQTKQVQSLSNRASAYLERVVKQVDVGMDALEASTPSTVKEVDQHFEALGKIDRIARPALGLQDTGNSGKGSLINIAVLQEFRENEPVKNCQEIQVSSVAN